jgi:hypothetical protein
VTFLPYVRRFLYGEGASRGGTVKGAESPLRVFRRNDVAKVRMTFPETGSEPATFDVAHVDLYFLYDIDVVSLVIEIFADDLSLTTAQDAMYRFGRAYPTYWAEGGRGGHCVVLAEWLGPTAPCWRSPITRNGKSTCATSDSVVLRAMQITGRICCDLSCLTIRAKGV